MSHGDPVALIKEQLGIGAVIGRYVQLQRKGNRLAARCPFHSEKTPSFYVDEGKGLFHCFGCHKGGDLIQFVRDMENLSFPEALDFLADLAGIELPKRGYSGPSRDLVEGLRAVNAEAADYYNRQLAANPHAASYFRERGIRDSTANLFKLGYAPGQWDGLHLHLGKKFEPKLLASSGLFKTSKGGKTYDLFRDRVIFPIVDAYGHVIAFGGRYFQDEEGPKYINSPETPLYTKGRHLYNLNFAKAFLKKSPELVVVEGYMDAIQVYQAGVGTVIASLGTAFTPEQAKLIKRFAKRVTLNFDGDPAGFRAARASIEICLGQDLDIGVVTLPDGQDPDDFVRKNGVEAYRAELGKATGFFEFLVTYLDQSQEAADPSRKLSLLAQEMCQTLRRIDDPLVRDQYLDRLAGTLEIGRHVVDQIFEQKGEPQARPKFAREDENRFVAVKFTDIERELLFHVINNRDYLKMLSQNHREALPKILTHVFHDRDWVLEFIHAEEADLSARLEVVPEPYRPNLMDIAFDQAFDQEDRDRLDALFPDLLREMLLKLVRINKDRIRRMPPHEEEKKKSLMRQNTQFMQQYHRL